MAFKTKEQLKAASDSTYPTTGLGAIAAADVRSFNGDLLDSTTIESDWKKLTVLTPANTQVWVKEYGDFCLLRVRTAPAAASSIQVTGYDFGGDGDDPGGSARFCLRESTVSGDVFVQASQIFFRNVTGTGTGTFVVCIPILSF